MVELDGPKMELVVMGTIATLANLLVVDGRAPP